MAIKQLLVGNLLLFSLSFGLYLYGHRQGSHLVEGGVLVKSLDIALIEKIHLRSHRAKDLSFVRDGNEFYIETLGHYPADIARIEDIIYKIGKLRVKKLVSNNPTDQYLEKYGLGFNNSFLKINFFDQTDENILSLRVGHQHNKGHYIYRLGSDAVYLTEQMVDIDLNVTSYIETKPIDFNTKDILTIKIRGRRELEIAKRRSGLELVRPIVSGVRQEKIEQYVEGLLDLPMSDFVAPEKVTISKNSFRETVSITLENSLTYVLKFAKIQGEFYLQIAAMVERSPDEFTITKNTPKHKVDEAIKIIRAQEKAEKLNSLYGKWLYRISAKHYADLIVDVAYFRESSELLEQQSIIEQDDYIHKSFETSH